MRIFIFLSIALLGWAACKTNTNPNKNTNNDKPKKIKNFDYLTYTKNAEEIEVLEQKIEKVYYSLLGHFVHQPQSDTLPKLYQAQEIISVPIWRKRKGEYWFYMGRFKYNFTENAIMEGICRVWRMNMDTIGLQYYSLPAEGNFQEEWRQESPFKDFSPSDLQSYSDCVSYIVKKENNDFEILPNEHPCPASLSFQIHYFNLGGTLNPREFKYRGAYFDENHVPVFQYKEGNELIFYRYKSRD